MFPTLAYQAVSTQKCHHVQERAPGAKGLTILPQIVFSYFWSFPQIVKINLRLPQIVF